MESKKLKQTQRYVLRLFMMGSTEHIKRMLPKLRAAEIVELMAHLRKSDQIRFLQLLFDVRMAAPTLTELPAELAKELIGEFADDTIAEMVRRLSPDDAVDLLAYLPEERQEQVLKQLNEKERWTLERLRLYEDDTAGGRMTTEYIALSGEMTAEEALDALRQKYEKSDLLDIYVTDDTITWPASSLCGVWSSHRGKPASRP